jgi:hypoxanthine phosphoribosyltransferase
MDDFGGKRLRVMISAEQIAARTAELGKQITEDYREHGRDLILVGVMKGSAIFLADLCRQVDLPCQLDFISIASYGDETKSSGVVQITADLSKPIADKHVIVIEDIVDTGLTMTYLLHNLETRGPKSIKVCSLLHKPERMVSAVPIAYLGFTIANEFVIGYGLDFAQRYRNLPYIGVLEDK